MGVSIWEGGKAERFVSALETVAEKVSQQKITIDDTAGDGDTDKVWSADKTDAEVTLLNSNLQSKADKNNSVFTGSISRGRASGTTTGTQSVVLGFEAEASGAFSYATGAYTKAAGNMSYTEGLDAEANGESSHASGYGTIANGKLSNVSGMNNVPDDFSNVVEWASGTPYSKGALVKITGSSVTKTYISKIDNNTFDPEGQNDGWSTVNVMKFANIVGNGANSSNKSNAFALDWNGNGYFNGDVFVNCDEDSTGGTRLPHDVQVNGVSVVNDGVANVPIASPQTVGCVRHWDGGGIGRWDSLGTMYIVCAGDPLIKEGQNDKKPIVPINQHKSVFYGLAKAAGNTDQSSSANAVGIYTNDAKVKIQKMLGIYEAPWELIREDTFTNATEDDYTITVDGNGEPFELTDVIFRFETPQQDTYSKKGLYGQVHLFVNNNDNLRIAPEPGAWEQQANAPAHGFDVFAEQSKGLIKFGCTQATTYTNSGSLRYRYMGITLYGERESGVFLVRDMVNEDICYVTKITIKAVTGTAHYKLYGKRKWT